MSLQCDDQKCADLGVRSAIEELEVALGEELHVLRDGMKIFLAAEDVLFLKGIAFSKGVDDIAEDIHVGHIEGSVRVILLDGVLYLDDDGAITFPGKQDGVQEVTSCILDVLQLGEQAVDLASLLANHCFFRFVC